MVKEFTIEEIEQMYEWCVRSNRGNHPVSDVVKKTLWSILSSSLKSHLKGFAKVSKQVVTVGLWEEEWQQIKRCCLENARGDKRSLMSLIEKL